MMKRLREELSTREVINLQFEYYVLNYDTNKKKVISYNIFRNINVQECTEREVKKYLHRPKNYVYKSFDGTEEICGFDALVKEIDQIIKWQEWSRCGYEMGVCYKFETDCKNIMHMDCYGQAHMNIEMIAREVIRQYKEQKKAKDGE